MNVETVEAEYDTCLAIKKDDSIEQDGSLAKEQPDALLSMPGWLRKGINAVTVFGLLAASGCGIIPMHAKETVWPPSAPTPVASEMIPSLTVKPSETPTPTRTRTPSPTLTPTSSPLPTETPDHRFGRNKITDEEYYALINTISKTSCLGEIFFDFIDKQTTDPERVGEKVIPVQYQKNCAGGLVLSSINLQDCIPYFIPSFDNDNKHPEIPYNANIYWDWLETDCSLAGWHYDYPFKGGQAGIPIYP